MCNERNRETDRERQIERDIYKLRERQSYCKKCERENERESEK